MITSTDIRNKLQELKLLAPSSSISHYKLELVNNYSLRIEYDELILVNESGIVIKYLSEFDTELITLDDIIWWIQAEVSELDSNIEIVRETVKDIFYRVSGKNIKDVYFALRYIKSEDRWINKSEFKIPLKNGKEETLIIIIDKSEFISFNDGTNIWLVPSSDFSIELRKYILEVLTNNVDNLREDVVKYIDKL